MNSREIIAKIRETGFDADKIKDAVNGYGEREQLEAAVGKVIQAAHYGGEGQGDSYWTVWHFVDHDVYLRADGWYASYDGHEYEDGFKEVRPKVVNETVYEKI